MRAMILAAGKGTRLRPLTDRVPKPLLDVAGQPMIAFPLALLRDAGVAEVVINLHHLGGQIRSRLGDGGEFGVHITYSEEDPILDTGGAIAAAREFLCDDAFAVLNADTVIDLRLRDVVAFHREHHALATMVVRPDPDAARKDAIGVDAGGRLRCILGHPRGIEPGGPAGRMMYAGIIIFEPGVFEYFPRGVYSITRDVYPRLLDAGEPLYAFVHRGYWRVLDTPHDLAAGRAELAEKSGQAYSLDKVRHGRI